MSFPCKKKNQSIQMTQNLHISLSNFLQTASQITLTPTCKTTRSPSARAFALLAAEQGERNSREQSIATDVDQRCRWYRRMWKT